MVTTETTSNDDNIKILDRDTFIRELAKALQDSDDQQQQNQQKDIQQKQQQLFRFSQNNRNIIEYDDTLIYNTYQSLCHNDPIHDNITFNGCCALAQALLMSNNTKNNTNHNNKKYALSNKLMDGIKHCLDRYQINPNTKTNNNNNDNDNNSIVQSNPMGDQPSIRMNASNNNETTIVEKNSSSIISINNNDATTVNMNSTSSIISTEIESAKNDKNSNNNIMSTNFYEKQEETQQPKESQNHNDDVDKNESLSLLKKDNLKGAESSMTNAYCMLAWIIYGRIPLLCLLSNNINQVYQLLGSFTTKKQEKQTDASVKDHDEEMRINNIISNNGMNNKNNINDDDLTNTLNNIMNQTTAITVDDNDKNNNNDHDSLQEVWANESDASDYEYESDYNITQQVNELDVWIQTIKSMYDPIQLSKPPSLNHNNDNQWDDVCASISFLLQSMTYSNISSLNENEWKQLQISDYITQLIITLLIIPEQKLDEQRQQYPILHYQQSNNNNNNNNEQQCCYAKEHWQQIGIQILNVFRDMSLQCITTYIQVNNKLNNNTCMILDEYLQVVTTLLKVYNVTNIDNNNSTTTTNLLSLRRYDDIVIPPPTFVGVSSLSVICHEILQMYHTNNKNNQLLYNIIKTIQLTIERSCDDLSYILEIAMNQYSKRNNAIDDLKALLWTYLSFFQIISTKTTTHLLSLSSNNNIISTSLCQILLNSGLFRQLLLCWEFLINNKDCTITTNNQSIIHAIEDSIYDLCIGSPTLLGKYTWRFPNFAIMVTRHDLVQGEGETKNHDDNIESDNVSFIKVFLWNLLGISLNEGMIDTKNTTSQSTVRWKNKKDDGKSNHNGNSKSGLISSNTIITVETCQQVAWDSFRYIFQNILVIITDWKKLREKEKEELTSIIIQQQQSSRLYQKRMLNDFGILVSKLISSPLLVSIFHKYIIIQPDDDNNKNSSRISVINEEISTIQKVLSTIRHNMSTDELVNNIESSNESSSSVEKKHTLIDEEDTYITRLRKDIKMLSLTLDGNKKQLTSFDALSISSKTD